MHTTVYDCLVISRHLSYVVFTYVSLTNLKHELKFVNDAIHIPFFILYTLTTTYILNAIRV